MEYNWDNINEHLQWLMSYMKQEYPNDYELIIDSKSAQLFIKKSCSIYLNDQVFKPSSDKDISEFQELAKSCWDGLRETFKKIEENPNGLKYREEKKDLFDYILIDPDNVYFAQCISADFGCDAGISLEFNEMFNTKSLLKLNFPNYEEVIWSKLSGNQKERGSCIKQGRVFNLITKTKSCDKPTYESLRKALESLKAEVQMLCVNKLVMPKIGCGLDGLEWTKVSEMIKEVFADVDMEIIVCYLQED